MNSQKKKIINSKDYKAAAMFACHFIQESLRKKYGKSKNILQLLGTAVKKKLLTDGEAIFIHQYGMRVLERNPNIESNARKDTNRLAKIIAKISELKSNKRKRMKT